MFMKKATIIITVIIFAFAVYRLYHVLYTSNTKFDVEERYIKIKEGEDMKTAFTKEVQRGQLLKSPALFLRVANMLHVWDKAKPGRYAIPKDASIMDIIRLLKNNQQSNTVKFTIKKLQTKEGLADIIYRIFDIDPSTAIQFLTNNDSLRPLGVDTNTVFTLIIPDTFTIAYKSSIPNLLSLFKKKSDTFWTQNNRKALIATTGLTLLEFYTLASIVEEETSKNDEKSIIASVYINRLKKGMKLGADPTVKYALRQFNLRRILIEDTKVASPYNTYVHKGLPPGPICTPSKSTIDALLPIPSTNYLFFVAKEDLSGYHTFTTNYEDHLQAAKKYQAVLDAKNIKR